MFPFLKGNLRHAMHSLSYFYDLLTTCCYNVFSLSVCIRLQVTYISKVQGWSIIYWLNICCCAQRKKYMHIDLLSLSLSHDMSTCIFSLKAKLAKSSHHTKPIVHCRSWRIIIIHGTLCWKAFTTPSLPILSLIGLWTMRCDG